MKCVVPIMTPEISAVAVPDDLQDVRNAVVMPDVTSGVVGVLILATTVQPIHEDGVGVRAPDVDPNPQAHR